MTARNSVRPAASSTRMLVRAVVGVLTVALAATPVLTGGPAEAKKKGTPKPQFRAVSAPNTFWPVGGTKRSKDQRTYSRHHRGTDITAPCGATVRASQPGIALVAADPKGAGRSIVWVMSSRNGLVTRYASVGTLTVTHGQLVQSGQTLGTLARDPKTNKCSLFYSVRGNGRPWNATAFLNRYVGQPAPVSTLLDTTGFTVASFNMLGASHTPSARYPSYAVRTPRALSLLKTRGVDVAGLQEFETRQADMFLGDTTYEAAYGAFRGGKPDSRNAIVWRRSTMELVSKDLLPIKYFNGSIIQIPVVLLRHRASGRTAWFMNTHNPASGVFGYGNQSSYRNYDLAVQRAKMIELRATGRPVIMTGDFNDRQAAFCAMTAQKLSISPNSIPSSTCAYPQQSAIDWIFAAGQARFSSFTYDRTPKTLKISDHPMVMARTHLQN